MGREHCTQTRVAVVLLLSASLYCLFLWFLHPCGCHKPSSDLIAEQRNPASSTTRSSKDFFPIPKFLRVESVNLLSSFQTCPYLATTIPGIVDEQEMSDIWLLCQVNFAREQQLWVWRYCAKRWNSLALCSLFIQQFWNGSLHLLMPVHGWQRCRGD